MSLKITQTYSPKANNEEKQEAKEFLKELEDSANLKFTYIVPMRDFNAITESGSADEKRIKRWRKKAKAKNKMDLDFIEQGLKRNENDYHRTTTRRMLQNLALFQFFSQQRTITRQHKTRLHLGVKIERKKSPKNWRTFAKNSTQKCLYQKSIFRCHNAKNVMTSYHPYRSVNWEQQCAAWKTKSKVEAPMKYENAHQKWK